MLLLRNYKIILLLFLFYSASAQPSGLAIPGAYATKSYFPLLKNKKVALVVNHTSVILKTHLVDSLLASGIQISKILAPEHGFRGIADAGAHVDDSVDQKSGLPIISLYGTHKKPTPEDLKNVDILVFDIQDVGVRFYTYSSTLHYVMEACAENKVPLLILDRANPNGHYIDGPVLDRQFASFVGLNPIPIVHGCTLGELAKMINGEGWLANKVVCDLKVIPVQNYTHESVVHISIAPSPNLPNDQSIGLYPSLCLFEATPVSIGRGTKTQFQVAGLPMEGAGDYQFTPVPMSGAMDPPQKGKLCFGFNLTTVPVRPLGFSLKYLFFFFAKMGKSETFFSSPSFFDRLAGTDTLRMQMLSGQTESQIRASWEPGLKAYSQMRLRYLLYK
jgi:uncharacterized protein YbbC (DUF1343 family)